MQVQSDHENTICVWFALNKPSLERKCYDSHSYAAIFLREIRNGFGSQQYENNNECNMQSRNMEPNVS